MEDSCSPSFAPCCFSSFIMAQSIMILTDGAGNSWRVDRDAIVPVLERAHMPLPPCPRGWSRVDYLYGADDECAVPVLMRDVAVCLGVSACALSFVLILHRQSQQRRKGKTQRALYRANSWHLAGLLGGMSWLVSSVAGASLRWALACYVVCAVCGTEATVIASTAFLNNAIDTLHALQPARAALWHGRVASTFDTLRPCFMAITLFGFSQCASYYTGSSQHIGGTGMPTVALWAMFGAPAVMFLITSAMMFLGSIGTARTARALLLG